jgi:hypothetical protein
MKHPNELLDLAREAFGLRSDAELARLLNIRPPAISKMCHGYISLSPAIQVRLLEATGLHIRESPIMAKTLKGPKTIYRVLRPPRNGKASPWWTESMPANGKEWR